MFRTTYLFAPILSQIHSTLSIQFHFLTVLLSQVSLLIITTNYGPDDPGFNSGRDKTFSVLQTHPDQLWGPLNLLFNGCRFFFLGVSRPDCEVGHSPLSSSQVKTEWSCTSASPAYLRGVLRD